MAVIYVKEAKNDKGARARNASFTAKGRKYNRSMIALCDSYDDAEEAIYAHADCPNYGDPHPDNAVAIVESVEIEPLGGGGGNGESSEDADGPRWAWQVDVAYNTEAEGIENPLDRDPQVSWERSQFEKPVDRDLDNRPIHNSAGQMFDPPVMKDDSRPVLKIVRNEATFDASLADTYSDSINSEPWKGGAPFTWKCAGITAQARKENGVNFWEVAYEFHYRKETWIKSILDQGRYERDLLGDDPSEVTDEFYGKLIPIRDKSKQIVSDPVPLNGEGKKATRPSLAAYLQFRVYQEVDFNALAL